jgi:hypothetical protein
LPDVPLFWGEENPGSRRDKAIFKSMEKITEWETK